MQQIALCEFLADVLARKAQLGFDEGAGAVAARRNKGARRTFRKAAILARAQDRARAAGRERLLIERSLLWLSQVNRARLLFYRVFRTVR